MTNLLFMMGPTNVGKGYTISYAVAEYGGYPVSVGNLLRAKYGPDFFKGQQSPEHTRDEARKMMVEGIKFGIDQGYDMILVDGQPRELTQIDAIFDTYINGPLKNIVDVYFLLLHCDDELRMKRLLNRDKDPAALELSKKRFAKDTGELQKIFYQILLRDYGKRIIPMDMTNSEEAFDEFYDTYFRTDEFYNTDFKTIAGS